jgi:hypothetical protein
MERNVECYGTRVALARMYRLVKPAALLRNVGQPACEAPREGSVVQTESAGQFWRLAPPLFDQNGDLALEAQVHLWIERNSSNSNVPAAPRISKSNESMLEARLRRALVEL